MVAPSVDACANFIFPYLHFHTPPKTFPQSVYVSIFNFYQCFVSMFQTVTFVAFCQMLIKPLNEMKMLCYEAKPNHKIIYAFEIKALVSSGFSELMKPVRQANRPQIVVFAARCYASAAYVVMRSLSVCVCVCVRHVRVFCHNE